MRILLVEDEPNVRMFLARAMEVISPCAEVLTAEDGRQALACLTSGAFDLVISDQHMPHVSGLDLLRIIRRSSDVPFVLISADGAMVAAAAAAGASWFLAKPFTLDELRQAVDASVPSC